MKRETGLNVVSNAIRVPLDERWICLSGFPVCKEYLNADVENVL